MKDSAYAFAVSAVRVRENGLLSRNQMESLITAADDGAALRLLEDFGYKGITSDAEKALSDRISYVTDFVTDVAPDKDLLLFLFVNNDFHNLKAAMKCSVSGIDPEPYFLPAVSVGTDEIKKIVAEKKFADLPELLRQPAAEAWNVLVSTMNGQNCEVILDRAAIEASVSIAQSAGDEFCTGLAKLRRKCAAFLIAYRCAVSEKTADFINTALPETDAPAKRTLLTTALSGRDAVLSLAEGLGFGLPAGAEASDITAASNKLEDEYMARSAFVSMGIAPVISYYLRSVREVEMIRVILSCKRCGLSDDICRKRAGL